MQSINNPVNGESKTETIMLNMGPQHPSTHGVLYVILELDGEFISRAEPCIGYLHRGIEKMAENRDYYQTIPLTNRCDYVIAFAYEHAYVLAVEKLLGIKVPERAEYIRIIMMELARIASHLLWISAYGMDLGAFTPIMYAFRDREYIMDLFDMAAGYRLMPNYFRFGGVKEDIPDGFIEKTLEFTDIMLAGVDEYEALLSGNEIFIARTKNVGHFKKDWAINIGLTGPALKSTGFKWDLRKEEPYSIYDRFEFDIPVGTNGDCYDAYKIRMQEMRESVKIIKQAASQIPDGAVRANLPRVIKPPKGEAYARVESSRGEIGAYVVSDGSSRPFRFKLRAPSFVNLMTLPTVLVGEKIADVVAIIGILDVVLGEVDR